jgi:hypothetical protein
MQDAPNLAAETGRQVHTVFHAAESLAAAILATSKAPLPPAPATHATAAADWRAGYAACLAHLATSPRLAELVKALEDFKRFTAAAAAACPARYGLPDVSGLAADATADAPLFASHESHGQG